MSGVILNRVAWIMVNQKYFKENFVLTELQEEIYSSRVNKFKVNE